LSGKAEKLNSENLTPQEYDILDELYFICTFDQLLKNLTMDDSELRNHLEQLFRKGWIKVFYKGTEEEVEFEDVSQDQFENYHFLATKAGLKAHNSL
jgi:DNA-binding MarR family transcriptional regulator